MFKLISSLWSLWKTQKMIDKSSRSSPHLIALSIRTWCSLISWRVSFLSLRNAANEFFYFWKVFRKNNNNNKKKKSSFITSFLHLFSITLKSVGRYNKCFVSFILDKPDWKLLKDHLSKEGRITKEDLLKLIADANKIFSENP